MCSLTPIHCSWTREVSSNYKRVCHAKAHRFHSAYLHEYALTCVLTCLRQPLTHPPTSFPITQTRISILCYCYETLCSYYLHLLNAFTTPPFSANVDSSLCVCVRVVVVCVCVCVRALLCCVKQLLPWCCGSTTLLRHYT